MPETGSVKRAVDILNLFTKGHDRLGPTQVAQELHLNKTTVIRLMSTLVSSGLLKKTSADRKYSLGGGIMDLAWAFLLNADLKTVSQPYLEKLCDITGETISLDIREGNDRVCILIIEGNYPVRLGAKVVGERASLHAGADSKLLLAYMPDKEIDGILQRNKLTRYTKATITNRDMLKKEIENIRAKGFSLSKEERWEYVYCISAPIWSYTHKVVASVSIFGLIMRLTEEKEKEFPELLKRTANEISHQLGYWSQSD